MRVSQFFLSTLKEAPAEAELISHKLMLRAGLIRRLATGIYTWMPLGLRVLRKVEAIVREEMNRAGAIEISMPIVQPAELWQETGRWQAYGDELLRFKDRHERDFVIQPTSEEVVTDIARHELKSYRQLPVNFYQIQTKFRDERRPRFGIMRGREFVMKDAYSFHMDKASLEATYQKMYDAYTRIFTRLGLQFRAVAADTGSIGGTGSHEFQVLADAGEDVIAYCPTSDYAANIELAPALAPTTARKTPAQEMKKVATPGKKTCADVAAFLDTDIRHMVKAIAIVVIKNEEESGEFALILLRGDHELNEVKTQKLIGAFRLARADEIEAALHCKPGYIGPVGADAFIYADHTVAAMSDFVCGANAEDHHLTGVNFGRDLPEPARIEDFRNAVAGDHSPDGKGILELCRGIEVGHVFQLGTKYSQAMNAAVLDEQGKARVVEMGCYGIGISRIVAAAIEQNFDERGILWTQAMSPFDMVIVPMGYGRSAAVKETTDKLYAELTQAGVTVLLDDRDERPGVLLADAELLGMPWRVVIGERGLKEGKIEIQARRETTAQTIALENAGAEIQKRLSE